MVVRVMHIKMKRNGHRKGCLCKHCIEYLIKKHPISYGLITCTFLFNQYMIGLYQEDVEQCEGLCFVSLFGYPTMIILDILGIIPKILCIIYIICLIICYQIKSYVGYVYEDIKKFGKCCSNNINTNIKYLYKSTKRISKILKVVIQNGITSLGSNPFLLS